MYDGITLKGDFQGIESRIATWFLGVEKPLVWRDWALVGYAVWLGALFTVVTAASVADQGLTPQNPVWPLAILAASAFIAEGQSVRLSPRAEISVSFLPIVLAAVIYGPVAAIGVSVKSLLLSFRRPYGRWFLWTATRSIAAGCAGMVAMSVAKSGESRFGALLAAVAA